MRPDPGAESIQALRRWREWARTPVVRNAGYLLATEAVAGALGFIFWVVAARLFADDEVGLGATLVASGTFLAILSTLGFNISLVRFLPERSAAIGRLVNSSVTVGVAVAAVLAVAFGLGVGAWMPVLSFLGANPGLLLSFAALVAVWTMYLLFDAVFIGLGSAKHVLVRAAIYNGLKIPLPFALGFAVAAPFALFSAWGVAMLVANVLAVALFLPRAVPGFRLRPDLDRRSVGPMLRYSFANHAVNVLGLVPVLAFPLLVAAWLGPGAAGYFYIAWVLANFLFIVPASIFTSVFAEGSRWLPGLRGNAVDGLFLSIAILVPGVGGALIAGPWILGALRSSFLAAIPVLNVLAASSFFVAVNVLYMTVLRVAKRMRPLLGFSTVTTLGSVALCIPLMSTVQLLGAALAFAIPQAAGAAYASWAMMREGVLRKPR